MDISKLPDNIKIEVTKTDLLAFAKKILEGQRELLEQTKLDPPDSIESPSTTKEIAAFLDVTIQHVYWLTSNRRIPFVKKGRRNYFFKSKIKEWLDQSQQKTHKDLEAQAEAYLEQEKIRRSENENM